MRRYSYLLFSLLLALTFTSCDSDENGNGNSGVNNITISGDYSESFEGSAFFVIEDDNTGDPDFAVGIISGSLTNPNAGQIVVFGWDNDRPDEGVYAFDASDSENSFSGGYTDATSQTDFVSIPSQSGTIEITESSDSRVEGEFSFTGQVVTTTGPAGTATVSGSFSAQFLDADDNPGFPTLQPSPTFN